MILTLEEAKRWLRLEEGYAEEDGLLQILLQAAEKYLANATGRQDWGDDPIAKLFVQVLIADWYEHREAVGQVRDELRTSVRSILLQLQYAYPDPAETEVPPDA